MAIWTTGMLRPTRGSLSAPRGYRWHGSDGRSHYWRQSCRSTGTWCRPDAKCARWHEMALDREPVDRSTCTLIQAGTCRYVSPAAGTHSGGKKDLVACSGAHAVVWYGCINSRTGNEAAVLVVPRLDEHRASAQYLLHCRPRSVLPIMTSVVALLAGVDHPGPGSTDTPQCRELASDR